MNKKEVLKREQGRILINLIKRVQVGNDQEKAQSEPSRHLTST